MTSVPTKKPSALQARAFDHPLVKPNSAGIANGGDRVQVPKDCACPKCTERLARYAAEGLTTIDPAAWERMQGPRP